MVRVSKHFDNVEFVIILHLKNVKLLERTRFYLLHLIISATGILLHGKAMMILLPGIIRIIVILQVIHRT